MAFDDNKKQVVVAAANADTTIAVGTPAASLADVTSSFSQSVLNDNFATLGTEINQLKTALRAAGILST
jgi:hypothetical protein